jgi:Zinc finger C-x8-C-x5-C-x3-H type (and similar)
LRPEERECTFYVRHGWCAFSDTCKFNHPELQDLAPPPSAVQLHGLPAIATRVQQRGDSSIGGRTAAHSVQSGGKHQTGSAADPQPAADSMQPTMESRSRQQSRRQQQQQQTTAATAGMHHHFGPYANPPVPQHVHGMPHYGLTPLLPGGQPSATSMVYSYAWPPAAYTAASQDQQQQQHQLLHHHHHHPYHQQQMMLPPGAPLTPPPYALVPQPLPGGAGPPPPVMHHPMMQHMRHYGGPPGGHGQMQHGLPGAAAPGMDATAALGVRVARMGIGVGERRERGSRGGRGRNSGPSGGLGSGTAAGSSSNRSDRGSRSSASSSAEAAAAAAAVAAAAAATAAVAGPVQGSGQRQAIAAASDRPAAVPASPLHEQSSQGVVATTPAVDGALVEP